MSNDSVSIQTSTESNSQMENQIVNSENSAQIQETSMNNLAMGIHYFQRLLINKYAIFPLVMIGISVIISIFSVISRADLVFCSCMIGACIAGASIICLLWPMFLSMKYFIRTPKEIFPHAKRTIVVSFALLITLTILDFATGFFELFNQDLNNTGVALNIISVVGALLTGFSYYCYYNFLSVIGEKIHPLRKDCKGAVVCMTLSCIVFAISYFVNCFEIANIDMTDTSSLASGSEFLFSNILWIIGVVLYIIGEVLVFIHIGFLKAYFYKKLNMYKLVRQEEEINSSDKNVNTISIMFIVACVLGWFASSAIVQAYLTYLTLE